MALRNAGSRRTTPGFASLGWIGDEDGSDARDVWRMATLHAGCFIDAGTVGLPRIFSGAFGT
jgi:hypothetical protein